MSPDQYWQQFTNTVAFDRPKTVEGVLEARRQEGRRDDPIAVILLRDSHGWKHKVYVTPARLLSEMMRQQPQLGDTVCIVYKGEAEKSAPGMGPTKEFDVTVSRKTAKSDTSTTAETRTQAGKQ